MSTPSTIEDRGYFIREVEVSSLSKTLKFYQKKWEMLAALFGMHPWFSLITLRNMLCKISVFKNRKIIELGAGVGCVGVLAACFGGDVIMTDLEVVLPLLERNIQENKAVWVKAGGHVEAKELCWGRTNVFQPPNLLLLADCVYYSESVKPLIETMKQLSNMDTEIIICQEKRESEKQQKIWEQFTSELERYFVFKTVPMEEQHSLFSSPDILLMKGRLLES